MQKYAVFHPVKLLLDIPHHYPFKLSTCVVSKRYLIKQKNISPVGPFLHPLHAGPSVIQIHGHRLPAVYVLKIN